RSSDLCGVSRAEVETARQLPTTRGLTAWCYEMSHRPFHIAAAGLLVGLESQVPGIYKRNLPPLKTHYGFTDHEVEFFAIHIEADEVHGERGYQIVELHSDTPERRAQALEQVRQATAIRVAALPDVAVGQPTLVEAGATRVVLVRIDDRVHALGDVCAHKGGPLS